MAGSCRDRLSRRTGSHAYCCLDPPHGGCLGCVEKETNLRRRYCVNASRPTRLDIIAAIGLAVGGAFGLTGTFVAQLQLARYFRAIDAVGFLVAIALLTLKYFRKGDDCLAAGFLVSARS